MTLARIILVLVIGEVMIGCAARVPDSAYVEPVNFGVVAPGVDDRFTSASVVILNIDGNDSGQWHTGSNWPVYLHPGEHTFRVERRQATPPTMVLMFDLITTIQDTTAALQHHEMEIAFSVKAGAIYRIHHDEIQKTFYVSVRKGPFDPDEPPVLHPPYDAVPCVKKPDRASDLWCELRENSGR